MENQKRQILSCLSEKQSMIGFKTSDCKTKQKKGKVVCYTHLVATLYLALFYGESSFPNMRIASFF